MRDRAVLDCMVFLQAAARTEGPAAACLELVRRGKIDLVIHPDILKEIEDVLTRPKVLAKFPALSSDAVKNFLDEVDKLSKSVLDVRKHFLFERDPKDEIYLNLAIAANARYLVTWDKDLLDLMKLEKEEAQSFQSRFPGLIILSPVALLQKLAQQQQLP